MDEDTHGGRATRKRLVVTIRRVDHKSDGFGAIFLGASDRDDQIEQTLRAYFGSGINVRGFERDGDAALRVSVDATAFERESQNLVQLGRPLLRNGRIRSALHMMDEALRLDPLNADAWKGRGRALVEAGNRTESHRSYVRAAEIQGYDGETLRVLASIALEENRRPSALEYLRKAIALNPEDAAALKGLGALEREVQAQFEDFEEPIPQRKPA